MRIKGNGSITAQEPNRYKCRSWLIQVQTDCGRKTKRFHGTLTEAKAARDDFIDELIRSEASSGFAEYAWRWYESRNSTGSYSPNTMRKNRTAIRKLEGYIDMDLMEIDRMAVESAISKMREDGLSGTTVKSYYMVLHGILSSAVSDGILRSNPCDSVKSPKTDTEQVEALSSTEMTGILDRIDDMPFICGESAAFYLMVCLGLRSQEAVAIRWCDVDFDTLTVHIRRAYKAASNTVEEPKSKCSKRDLPLPMRLCCFLERWKSEGWSDYLVCPHKGRQLGTEDLRQWARRNGFPTKFHQLRHSYCTIMAANGTSPYVLQKLAGWADLDMAMVYCKVGDEQLRNAVESARIF